MSETIATPRVSSMHRMEILVGYILQVGVLLSISLIAVGVVWRWFNTGSVGFDYSISGMNFFEFVWSDIQQMLAGAFRPRLLANLGMATLMLTPYVRVLASMLYFGLAAHNRKYTLFTGFVFLVLTYSLFLR
jgi:uncharacterized membrane protein